LQDLLEHDADVMAKIGAALPALVELAAANGHVSDEQMDVALGAVFAGIGNPVYERCANAEQPINHRRCIWMSNATWRASELARIAAKEAVALAESQARAAAAARRQQGQLVGTGDTEIDASLKRWNKLDVAALKELCAAKTLQVVGSASRKQPYLDALVADMRSRVEVAPAADQPQDIFDQWHIGENERIANAIADQSPVNSSSDDDDDDVDDDDDDSDAAAAAADDSDQ
jgi:hypothetical protein